ncbi:RidA family protein [Permianibacter aggregans]|uniref:Enamine deaminase RidA (YjgF/YER057c/UK114 family) n=1 Tax=Permianibacter aggregans TaxID=1510150 RepID=A0A4R6US87_9GAMM|nr:RidA family protein [Permianibacter aggregans]QGX38320.1 RidA family protein [Permianibacter aggregans]TDQ48639.1 enamine deaminase RidA (YjgF/YER057c/UK114 family) [Permianibacter aggregans]
MPIKRLGTTVRWSDAVIHNGTVYCVEVAENTDSDLPQQTQQVLTQLESTLKNAGSDKTRLLSVTIFLKDIKQIGEFNAIWDRWVPTGTAPSRACVQAVMADPGYLVELQVTAATD